jgi:diacylglycerol O-acyltransferase / wax synthase
MTESLTALDATFLELEEADPCVHMHIGGIMVFDPQPDGATPSLEQLSALLEQRLGGLARYRQRLSETSTGGVSWPAWVEDERFAMDRHCRRSVLPPPGDRAELERWAGEFFSQRLDRSAPLWEMVLVEGLEGGRWAIASKTHHCMVDGVGSIGVAQVLLDTEPDPGPADDDPDAELAHPAHHDDEHGSWYRLAVAGVDAVLHPLRVAEAAKATAELLVRDELIAAPQSSINAPIGAHRRYTVVDVDLDAVKAIKRTLGGTVNDVVLAAVSGGLRALLEHRGDAPPEAGLRAMVPVNVRDPSDKLGLGNRISSLFVPLPVGEADPARRFASARGAARRLKSGDAALGSTTLVDLLALAPPALHSAFARSLFATRLFNVTVTNVPGPQLPLYALGARMREIWPLVPLAADHSVGVAILSYDGRLFFGLVADRDVDDLDVLADGVRRSLDELGALLTAEHAREPETAT